MKKIAQEQHGGVTVLRPNGPLVGEDVGEFVDRLESVRSSSLGRMVVDFTTVPFVDSAGLEALVDTSELMADSGQPFRLSGVNATIREVLELTELSSMFEHYENVNAAVRSFL
ncbi:MAG: STAS domain-containing protein [Phycisphaerae bacterium]|nr:STAS domain-containing protein [Phycisphaerae bacterium]